MNRIYKRLLLLLVISMCYAAHVSATHLRAGEITVRRVNCSNNTFQITITVYVDTNSPVQFGGDGEVLYFGDSTFALVPGVPSTPRPDLGENIGVASYTIEHTYSGPGSYLIRYAEAFRNGAVINMTNPLGTNFYIETLIKIDPFMGCDNSPALLVPPVDKACTGAAWFHNPGAYDIDGDSLSYEMSIPKGGKGVNVNGYKYPNRREFYDAAGIDYTKANEAKDDVPSFKIDPKRGTVEWNAPGIQGEYNIAFIIKEWRKVNGVPMLIGYVVRDMQILVEDCMNQRPELIVPPDICVEAGTLIKEDIFGFDPDSQNVKIEAFSEVFIVNPSPATTTPATPVFQPSSPTSHAKVSFQWQTDCAHVKDQSYQVVFKITDKPARGASLVKFMTWNIRVVGPAPKWRDATVIPANRSASLSWEPYQCKNAISMQVWRRVDAFAFDPGDCETGIPATLGYSMIAELPSTQTSYSDLNGGKGLAVGAKYCYRLVAIYPAPGGGESYVSKEICLEPILADAPVITNVTVDKTSSNTGQITVKWIPAFDLNAGQFPPPYTYEVYRAEGITGNSGLLKAHPGRLSDTTYTDTGINTDALIYNYRIVLFDGNNNRVDTSAVASSVRLEAKPLPEKIELAWAADVPWNNKTVEYPTHLIYRGTNGVDGAMELIANVNVNQSGFRYVDQGDYQQTPLDKTKTYCYKIMTQGSYGNPKIASPLVNYSQTVCTQVDDKTAPCKPELSITVVSCEDIIASTSCDNRTFVNTIKWKRPAEAACRDDIRSYNLYVATKPGEKFVLYKTDIRDTIYVDNLSLNSFARCYQVTAVDRAGNESEPSEPYCFDNCPYYELPNAFTPNGDDLNEVFAAYGDPDHLKQVEIDPKRCARFVNFVDFVVYNRWGQEVYREKDSKERSIYIRWNGRDNQGRELPEAVYFYKATVYFNTLNDDVTELKGWVHLVRGKS